jgi:hypothetical protein
LPGQSRQCFFTSRFLRRGKKLAIGFLFYRKGSFPRGLFILSLASGCFKSRFHVLVYPFLSIAFLLLFLLLLVLLLLVVVLFLTLGVGDRSPTDRRNVIAIKIVSPPREVSSASEGMFSASSAVALPLPPL